MVSYQYILETVVIKFFFLITYKYNAIKYDLEYNIYAFESEKRSFPYNFTVHSSNTPKPKIKRVFLHHLAKLKLSEKGEIENLKITSQHTKIIFDRALLKTLT